MRPLTNFSPAELLVLMHDYQSPTRQEMLRVTFLDLLRRRVLRTEQNETPPAGSDTPQTYVVAGPALGTERLRPHERPLVQLFELDASLRISFPQYVRTVLHQTASDGAYKKQIWRSEALENLFQPPSWWRRLIGYRALTPAGRNLQRSAREELVRSDRQFSQLAQTAPAQARQLLQELQGLAFLLPTFISPIGRELEAELRRALTPVFESDADAGDTSGSWNDHSDTFDSHSGSHDGHSHGCSSDSSSHGCGGDSGCSGCGSGCSGCSGCGGD